MSSFLNTVAPLRSADQITHARSLDNATHTHAPRAAILDVETVQKMVPNCPEPSDVALVNAYEGDLKLLGKAELCHLRDRICHHVQNSRID
eukprot:SAG25_NODE_152_length_13602_cov_15.382878_3_plen_91_part_00